MGRPQNFNEEAVVEKAMAMFWNNGFEGTSTRDLIEGTGISNGSFFNSFGDKSMLYLKCLQKYETLYIAPLVTLLNASMPFRDKIKKVLTQTAKPAPKGEGYEGCFVFNTLIDRGVTDAGVRKLATAINETIGDALVSAVDQAKLRGEVAGTIKTAALAQYLFNAINGLRVMLLNNPSRTVIRNSIDCILDFLPK
jgi:TetR/AcrR family transcriptional repressor of nem operon